MSWRARRVRSDGNDSNDSSDGCKNRQNLLGPRGWSERTALLRFVVGCSLFSLGLLLTYRLDLGYKRAKLLIPCPVTLSGSVILIDFELP